jgi:hypothetical protein
VAGGFFAAALRAHWRVKMELSARRLAP